MTSLPDADCGASVVSRSVAFRLFLGVAEQCEKKGRDYRVCSGECTRLLLAAERCEAPESD